MKRVLEQNRNADSVILNLGVGRQSVAIAAMACDGAIPRPHAVIFSDTGWERKATLKYFEQIVAPMCESVDLPAFMISAARHVQTKGKQIGKLRRSGQGIRDDLLRSVRLGTPIANPPLRADKGDGKSGPMKRMCTAEYKIAPITKKIRELLGLKERQRATRFTVEQWIGIATEESKRAKGNSGLKWSTLRYPLLEMGMSTADCIQTIRDIGLPVPVKSACIGCPYRSDASWARMERDEPEAFQDAVEFDIQLRHPNGMGRLNDGLTEADYLAARGADIREKITGAKCPAYLHSSCTPLGEVDFSKVDPDGEENFGGEFC